jgi:hypothetical protein
MGLYKGWGGARQRAGGVSRRIIYHDEFRMGDAEATYEDVAPGPH